MCIKYMHIKVVVVTSRTVLQVLLELGLPFNRHVGKILAVSLPPPPPPYMKFGAR